MAEATFLSASSTILGNVRTWFNLKWASFPFLYGSPIHSGLEPLLLEGTTTLGNCRITCATARLVELSGLSSANIPGTNYSAAFRTCEKREVYITLPADFSVSAKVLYYAMDGTTATTAVVSTTATMSGALVLTVPFFSKGNEHTFRYDLLTASFNVSLSVVPPTVSPCQEYISAAVATEATNALSALRHTFGSFLYTPLVKAAVRFTPLVQTFALPTLTKQLTSPNCTLTGPCDPCDVCCLCVARQVCTDACKGCPCMTCSSTIQVHELLFYILIGTLVVSLLWTIRNKWKS